MRVKRPNLCGVVHPHENPPEQEEAPPGYRLPIEAVAVVIVALTGHLGGFLIGVSGPG
jgi:hypothetical protein